MSQTANYPSLSGRSVFVTGGGGGIGAAIVDAFCAQHARVAFIDRDADSSQSLIQQIAERGDDPPLFIEGDLRDIEGLKHALTHAASVNGAITVLVNNAAHDERHAIDDVTVEYWDDRMAVNLRHQFFAAQAVIQQRR